MELLVLKALGDPKTASAHGELVAANDRGRAPVSEEE
jgi:hypothetical protein